MVSKLDRYSNALQFLASHMYIICRGECVGGSIAGARLSGAYSAAHSVVFVCVAMACGICVKGRCKRIDFCVNVS